MKRLLKKISSVIYKAGVVAPWSVIEGGGNQIKFGGLFYKSRFIISGQNNKIVHNGDIEKSIFSVLGYNNELITNNATINEVTITVQGNNNRIYLEEGVILRKATIIVRGEGCSVAIGARSTFGGIRIVNVGKDNAVTIGENCLFSDFIELWASDTHAILDGEGNMINQEKPIDIGNNVWVGSRVIILKGVTIEDGSILGMGSVITKDVPSNVISAGYPNKTIKENVKWLLDYPLNR